MGIAIVGCGLGPDDLSERLRSRIYSAPVLAGGRRLLEWFPGAGRKRVVLGGGLRSQAAELLARAENEEIVVLASGDPLFFGIAATFLALAGPEGEKGGPGSGPGVRLEIFPNVSAVQAACARLGIDWSGFEYYNLHGREAETMPWRRILRAPAGAILLAGLGERAPARLAARLIDSFPPAAERRAVVCAALGGPDEELRPGCLAELASGEFPAPALLLLYPAPFGRLIPPPAWGLPLTEFTHTAGLITKPEVRAVILAKLCLIPGIFWDLGAGSGSVAIEAAAQQPGLQVLAVEKEPSRVELIQANVHRHGVAGQVEIHSGEIASLLSELPPPDRVFVGGGGERLGEIVERAFSRLSPGGLLLAAAVTLESRAVLTQTLPAALDEVVEINLSRGRPLGGLHLLKSENPVGLYLYRQEEK